MERSEISLAELASEVLPVVEERTQPQKQFALEWASDTIREPFVLQNESEKQ